MKKQLFIQEVIAQTSQRFASKIPDVNRIVVFS